MPKLIAFFGASGGCGYSSLTTALAAGHVCIALCRSPAKLDALAATYPSTLIVRKGNAHHAGDVEACLQHDGRPVDAVNFSIGSTMDLKTFKFIDPDVCKKGMAALLGALDRLRQDSVQIRPLLSVVSTTGISDKERDVPLLMLPMYHLLLATPHKDKKAMEESLRRSDERFVLVRPAFLVDGDHPDWKVRTGVEDVVNDEVERKAAVGYGISRAAVGRWMFVNVLNMADGRSGYERKAVSLSW